MAEKHGHTPERLIEIIADIARIMGWQAGEAGCDLARAVASCHALPARQEG